MGTGSSENPDAESHRGAHCVRVIIVRVVVTLAGPVPVVAVMLMASAPCMVLQPDQQTSTEPC